MQFMGWPQVPRSFQLHSAQVQHATNSKMWRLLCQNGAVYRNWTLPSQENVHGRLRRQLLHGQSRLHDWRPQARAYVFLRRGRMQHGLQQPPKVFDLAGGLFCLHNAYGCLSPMTSEYKSPLLLLLLVIAMPFSHDSGRSHTFYVSIFPDWVLLQSSSHASWSNLAVPAVLPTCYVVDFLTFCLHVRKMTTSNFGISIMHFHHILVVFI